MKRLYVIIPILCLLFIAAHITHAADESQVEEPRTEPMFDVSRLVIAGSVENLEPVGIVNEFAASTEKVYCFLEAKDIKEDTEVSFVWFHKGDQKATVTLPLMQGPRWRTYSSKKLGGMKGEWEVEIQNAEGNVLDSIGFTVE